MIAFENALDVVSQLSIDLQERLIDIKSEIMSYAESKFLRSVVRVWWNIDLVSLSQ